MIPAHFKPGRSLIAAMMAAGLLNVATTQDASAQNAPIINWGSQGNPGGGPYVTATTDLQGKNANVVGLATGRNFSTSIPMSPDPASPYSGVSATFYGGAVTAFQTTAGNTPGFEKFEVQNQGNNDMLNFQITQGSQQHDLHHVMYWDKADFLNTSAAVTFSAQSQFSITFTNVNSSLDNATGYWLVRQGSSFFLSQNTFVPQNGVFTFNPYVSASSDGFWAPYNPVNNSLTMNFDQGSASFSDTKFTDITAVGFYIDHDSFRDNFSYSIPGFLVTAAVPEPASIIMLSSVGLAVTGYVGIRRLKNRRKKNSDI